MSPKPRVIWLFIAAVLIGPWAATAADYTLTAVQFPERKDVDLSFVRSAAAPRGILRAEVEFKEGLGEIGVEFDGMKPAILFGGDVTSYVLWAVTREGKTDNLGELWVRDPKDSDKYTTGLKEFALLVTAETHPLVDRPSEMVMFYSTAATTQTARNTEFVFSGFGAAPAHERESIAEVPYDRDSVPDLQQAKKAFELAQREGAMQYAPRLMAEAEITLAQATNLATRSALSKGMRDYSRRTVALASEAIRMTERKKEAERLEREIAQRRAEMEALQQRVAGAEALAASAEAQAASAKALASSAQATARELERQKADLEGRMAATRAAYESLNQQRASLEAETARLAADATRLETEKAALATTLERMRGEQAGLIEEKQQLAMEKERLSERLKGALDQVASTEATGRGFIVNLPDILFDLNEATLKPEAQVAIAKLAGILLMVPELNLRIEGHTDSTGSASYNLRLSQRRADSVFDFLAGQGIAGSRMTSVGYGLDRPVADNATTAGRAKNRRVEIVIAEGQVQEAEAPR